MGKAKEPLRELYRKLNGTREDVAFEIAWLLLKEVQQASCCFLDDKRCETAAEKISQALMDNGFV